VIETEPESRPDPVLEARALQMQFQGLKAVDGISLALAPGEMLGLIGPNGAGKTTMFNMLAGSLLPTSGHIILNGQDVTRDRPEQRLGRGLGRTFQIPRPFAEMTVLENVLTGARDQAGEQVFHTWFSPGRVAREERQSVEKARYLLDFLLLSRLEGEPARVLSGGQRKLLELARLLMADPSVLLLDEPAAGVNPSLLEVIMERIQALNGQGKAILLIEHNMDMVARMCSRVFVMAAGRELAQGAPSDVIRDARVIQAYLGDAT
tara:strand:+ start:90973 stop:91764 length:792 start_codon:yes stop_codon:yes gene_type:complete